MVPFITNGNGLPRRQRGHLLLAAMVMVTTLTIILAMTMQPLQTTRQRQLEAELIYRGEHLAEGIRRFYFQHGRFPFELEELIDNEPRLVRQIYADPMTEDGAWTLVYLSAFDRPRIAGMNPGLNRASRRLAESAADATGDRALANDLARTDEENSENEDLRTPGLSRNPDSVFDVNTRQITGLRSRSDTEGFMVRDDSSIYADWLFTAIPKQQAGVNDLLQNNGNRP